MKVRLQRHVQMRTHLPVHFEFMAIWLFLV
jgi:hypothetical protein